MRLLSSSFFSRYYQSWLQRRVPPQSHQVLHRRNIFIFPSRVGVGFLFTVFLLWLLGTNYQNNLVLVLAFLLLSLMHTCIFYTYANLSGLSIEVRRVAPCFAGEPIKIECLLKNHRKTRSHRQISVGWDKASLVTADIRSKEVQELTIWLPAASRGIHHLDRLTVASVYPLGLIRTWAKLDMDITTVVYPRPVKARLPEASIVTVDQAKEHINVNSLTSLELNDDVSHLREYQEGDSLKHIAWKAYAKGQGLATKIYENIAPAERQQWLNWDDFSSYAVEERLSRLCYCILQADKQGLHYGLNLPHIMIPLGRGEHHRQAALYGLASFAQQGKG